MQKIIVNASNHTKCVSLSNQKCLIQTALINLYPNEYFQGLFFYPFAVNLDRGVRGCNTLNDLSNKVYGSNKRRFKSKHFQDNCGNKWVKNVDKADIMQMWM